MSAAPISEFADASIDGKTPYEQAKAHEANGQLWVARLVIETRALSAEGTTEEVELLADICNAQGDAECLEACGKRLGRKLKPSAGKPAPLYKGEHKEPDSDAARARDLLLKHRLDEARSVLESKVLEDRASSEEVRLLKSVCREQADRMCVALCDAKLK